MDLPENIQDLKSRLHKEAKKKGVKLWEQARALRPQEPFKEEILLCDNCGIFGHTHHVHRKNASTYEIVGGRIGCKEEFLACPNAPQLYGRILIKLPKARHWHKQNQRIK